MRWGGLQHPRGRLLDVIRHEDGDVYTKGSCEKVDLLLFGWKKKGFNGFVLGDLWILFSKGKKTFVLFLYNCICW